MTNQIDEYTVKKRLPITGKDGPAIPIGEERSHQCDKPLCQEALPVKLYLRTYLVNGEPKQQTIRVYQV